MTSRDGVVSIPFRLAISALVIALAVPICLQSLQSGRSELSKEVAMRIANDIAIKIEELSFRPVGESKKLEIADQTHMLGKETSLVLGDGIKGLNQSVIRCRSNDGWMTNIVMNLNSDVSGVCSMDLFSFIIDQSIDDLIISHSMINNYELIMVAS